MFSLRKHQIIFTNTHRLRSRLIGWRTQKKGARTSLFPFHPISFPLHTPYFCHPHRPTRMLVTVDADARNDRRGCSYRSARMLVSTDADDFCWCFAVPNLYFRGSKPPFLHFTLSFSCNIFLCFPRSVVLSCCVYPLVAVLKTVSLAYNNIMCASTMWCFNCK